MARKHTKRDWNRFYRWQFLQRNSDFRDDCADVPVDAHDSGRVSDSNQSSNEVFDPDDVFDDIVWKFQARWRLSEPVHWTVNLLPEYVVFLDVFMPPQPLMVPSSKEPVPAYIVDDSKKAILEYFGRDEEAAMGIYKVIVDVFTFRNKSDRVQLGNALALAKQQALSRLKEEGKESVMDFLELSKCRPRCSRNHLDRLLYVFDEHRSGKTAGEISEDWERDDDDDYFPDESEVESLLKTAEKYVQYAPRIIFNISKQ